MIHAVGPSPLFFGFLIFGDFKPSGFKEGWQDAAFKDFIWWRIG